MHRTWQESCCHCQNAWFPASRAGPEADAALHVKEKCFLTYDVKLVHPDCAAIVTSPVYFRKEVLQLILNNWFSSIVVVPNMNVGKPQVEVHSRGSQ